MAQTQQNHKNDNLWQTTKESLKERNEFMFNNELLSDVSFKVGKDDCKLLIPGHKYVLATASPVFCAMLYGDLATKDSSIDISDCESECFLELLRFIYSDQCCLTPDNVLGVLYLAKKYIVPVLIKKCVSFLMEKVTVENVLEVLQAAMCFNEDHLERRCWSVLSKDATATFNSDAFLEIDEGLLKKILEQNSLNITEIEVFRAVKRWLSKECTRRDLEDSLKNRKSIMKNIIKLVRFPVMSAKEFAEEPARSGLLPIEDIRDLFIFLNSGIKENIQYPTRIRQFKPYTCSRYVRTMKNYLWRYDEHDADGIRFKVSDEIELAGIGLYGSPCGGEYKVELVITTDDRDFQYSKSTTFTCPPDPEFNTFDCPQCHDILFEESLKIQSNLFYTITVLLDGPPSYAGDDGKAEVLTNDVKFTFENSGDSTNGTSFDEGQIPSLLFHF